MPGMEEAALDRVRVSRTFKSEPEAGEAQLAGSQKSIAVL